jgi:hypothetical protein
MSLNYLLLVINIPDGGHYRIKYKGYFSLPRKDFAKWDKNRYTPTTFLKH